MAHTVTHYRTCPLCEATCGLEITTRGDEVVRIRGDRSDPYSAGFICPKGSTLKQLHEDPDRLTRPVVKREGAWVEVGWDEAFAEIETRLAPVITEHGRQALAVVLGNPNVHNLGGMLFTRNVIFGAGTTNIFSASTVDQMPKHVSAGLMWGDPALFPLPDLDRTDYLLMLGANPFESNGSLVTVPDFPGRLAGIQERGGRFVVVDPRRTKTASAADEHLTIRPGTDAIWLLAIANVLFAEGLVDIGRLGPHVDGVAEVEKLVEPWTPEQAEARCSIPADTTRRISRELAAAPSAAVYGRIGTHTVEFGTLASWAADVLNVLTGNCDRPGGIMFSSAPTVRVTEREPGGKGFVMGRWTGRATGRPEVRGELPAAHLADELETPGEGQVRAVVLIASNPVRSFPNSARLDAALAGLDFCVAVDPYINASTRHADVILPPTSALERSHYDFAFEQNMIRSIAKYSPPVFTVDRPDESEILVRLGLVLSGQPAATDPRPTMWQAVEAMVDKELVASDSPIFGRERAEILTPLRDLHPVEAIIDLRVRVGRFGDGFGVNPGGLTLRALIEDHPHGVDMGPLVERFPSAIKTTSGKLELAPPEMVADLDRLADRAEALVPDGLVLVGRRHLRSCNTWMHNINVLIKGRDRCTLQLHPDDAKRLGVADGARATVRSRVGEVTAPVEVTDDLMAGVVSLPFGWGYDEPGIEMSIARTRPGVNSNALTDDAIIDDVSGNAVLNAIPVEVTPA